MKILRLAVALLLGFGITGAIDVPAQTTRTFVTLPSVLAWSSLTHYNVGDLTSSSGSTYISLVANNIGNTPATSPSDWAPVGASSGGSGASGGLCAIADFDDICLTASPYNASPFGAVTTLTTASLASSSTTVNVASSATYLVGNGVYIAGAGASAANYIGTVTTIPSGTQLTVTPPTSTSVASGVLVQHDETAAILAGWTALQATGVGGWALLPCPLAANTYLVNGPLLDTGGANAVLPVPRIANYGPVLINIGLKGCTRHNIGGTGPVILQNETLTAMGNFIGGYDADGGGGYAPFTNVALMVQDLTIVLPSVTQAVAINATAIVNVPTATRLLIRTVSAAKPSASTGGGLYMPAILNAVENSVDDVTIAGFTNGLKATEHTHIGSAHLENSINCLVLDNGTNTNNAHGSIGYNGNGTEADHIYFGDCTNPIAGGAGPYHSAFYIALADMELTSGNGFLDPSAVLYGIANVNITDSRGSTTPCNANPGTGVTSRVTIHYINCQPESGGGGGTSLTTNLIEEWPAHEGSGTTLSNTGTDYTNAMTMTSVTWASATGFTGNQPTYNGLMSGTSYSTATSATQTAFSGFTPFSVCAWHKPSTFTGVGEVYVVDNVSTALGWGFGEFGSSVSGVSGAMFVYIFSSGSNYISLHSPPGAVTAGAINHECFTYSGSGTAAGVAMYVNGVAQTPTVQRDNLTTSAATTLPVTIGSNAPSNTGADNGAIGKVEIWSRQLSSGEIGTLYTNGPTLVVE